ncbi:MAG: hypothetical protein ACYSYM_16735, partial [Planctomycetota bacterium]
AESGELAEARPEELPVTEMASSEEIGVDSAPLMTPPGLVEEVSYSTGVSAWQNSRKIDALWCINQNRNSWVHVIGIGWKKLSNKYDSATVALTTLGSSAKLTQSPVNYRDEADGMIHEMYVW